MRDLTPEYLLAALRQAIKTKGLTYRELSEKMGMPLSTFKRHLTSTNLALDKLLEYCRAVDCTLDELQKLAINCKVKTRITLVAHRMKYSFNSLTFTTFIVN